ncbi:MAG: NAD(P)-dependent oxidoreductase, partial [Actinomycetota bacterium]
VGVSRVVFTSSKAAVGTLQHPYIHPDYEPVSESVQTNPYDVYGSAKLAAEVLGKQLAEKFGIDLIVLRLASTYGPGKTVRHGKVGILSAIIEGAHRGEPVKISSGADQKNDFLYCKDIAQAVAKAGNANLGGYHMFHIGSGKLSSLRDFVAVLQNQLPDSDIAIGDGLDYAGGGSGHYFLMDIQAARTMLDYQPLYDVERGVADYVSSLRLHAKG